MPAPDPAELARFREGFLYRDEACLLDTVHDACPETHTLTARLETTLPLLYSRLQRNDAHHPPHVAAADLLAVTGTLGCLHAWLFHGVRWDEGWAGFGSRIHRADFKRIARIGPPLELSSHESRSRVGEKRIVLRFDFEFHQAGELVYKGDQSAMFLKQAQFGALA